MKDKFYEFIQQEFGDFYGVWTELILSDSFSKDYLITYIKLITCIFHGDDLFFHYLFNYDSFKPAINN